MNKVGLLFAARKIQQRIESGPISFKTLIRYIRRAGLTTTLGNDFIAEMSINHIEFIARVVPWMTGFEGIDTDAWAGMVAETDELKLYDRWWRTVQNLCPYEHDKRYRNRARYSSPEYKPVYARTVLIGSQLGRVEKLRPSYANFESGWSWYWLVGIYILLEEHYDWCQQGPPPEDFLRWIHRKIEEGYKT